MTAKLTTSSKITCVMLGLVLLYLHDDFKIGLVICLPPRVSNNESNRRYPQPAAKTMTLEKTMLNTKYPSLSSILHVYHFHLQVMIAGLFIHSLE